MSQSKRVLRISDIGLSPAELDNTVEERVKEKTRTLLQGKETKHGLILSVINIEIENKGEIRFDMTGKVRFSVSALVNMYIPVVGETIVSKIRDIPSNGFYLDEPVTFFVNTDSRTTKKVGDGVKVKITKVLFNKGKFMVLGKEL